MKRLVLLIAIALSLSACSLREDFFAAPLAQSPEQAPTFSFTTFDGTTYALEDFRGQIVVLNFWGSWCAPCRDEMPILQALHEQYMDQEVVFIGLSYVDSEPHSLEMIEELGITYLAGADIDTKVADAYGVQGVPETFIIDQRGNVIEHIIAPVNEKDLAMTLDQLLAS